MSGGSPKPWAGCLDVGLGWLDGCAQPGPGCVGITADGARGCPPIPAAAHHPRARPSSPTRPPAREDRRDDPVKPHRPAVEATPRTPKASDLLSEKAPAHPRPIPMNLGAFNQAKPARASTDDIHDMREVQYAARQPPRRPVVVGARQFGRPGEVRTHDHSIKSRMLYH
jgi:hypothetical protein